MLMEPGNEPRRALALNAAGAGWPGAAAYLPLIKAGAEGARGASSLTPAAPMTPVLLCSLEDSGTLFMSQQRWFQSRYHAIPIQVHLIKQKDVPVQKAFSTSCGINKRQNIKNIKRAGGIAFLM